MAKAASNLLFEIVATADVWLDVAGVQSGYCRL